MTISVLLLDGPRKGELITMTHPLPMFMVHTCTETAPGVGPDDEIAQIPSENFHVERVAYYLYRVWDGMLPHAPLYDSITFKWYGTIDEERANRINNALKRGVA